MWVLMDYAAAALAAVEWSTIWDVTLGAMLALWVTHQSPAGPGGRQVTIQADADHGCHTDLTTANGHTLRMLLDSGATGLPLVFGSNQIAALGISKGSLEFSHSYSSANGIGREAFVTLHNITLFGGVMDEIPAAITEAPMDEGLLGSELLHFVNFTTNGGTCRLTLPPFEAR
jgi:clan AA aspartic protease (TIGR02281 family)